MKFCLVFDSILNYIHLQFRIGVLILKNTNVFSQIHIFVFKLLEIQKCLNNYVRLFLNVNTKNLIPFSYNLFGAG